MVSLKRRKKSVSNLLRLSGICLTNGPTVSTESSIIKITLARLSLLHQKSTTNAAKIKLTTYVLWHDVFLKARRLQHLHDDNKNYNIILSC